MLQSVRHPGCATHVSGGCSPGAAGCRVAARQVVRDGAPVVPRPQPPRSPPRLPVVQRRDGPAGQIIPQQGVHGGLASVHDVWQASACSRTQSQLAAGHGGLHAVVEIWRVLASGVWHLEI